MNALKSLLVLSAVVLAAGVSSANPSGVTLGDPSYGGNGCPQGSASSSITPDGSTLSILFDSFIAEAGNTTGRRLDRKSCNIAIPIHVPQGYSVALIGLDYRGFNAVPGNGAYTQFSAQYFYAGSQGPTYTKRFTGPQVQDFQVINNLIATSLVWSRCGADVIFRVNAGATAVTNNRMEQTSMSIDSIDANARLLYNFQWRRCN